ncbi:MAG: hypothetical protein KDE58_40780 [Caldilineaceae bacterium]|nr:hypothetical protein [Caldilineaceae bacterium]
MISTYTELLDEVLIWSHRTDLTARIPNFIALCEADMQVRCKLLEFEASASITVTAGVGALPTGFTGMRSIYWDGNTDRPLRYITPAQMDAKRQETGDPNWYTVSGSSLLISPAGDGTVVINYRARFTPLSGASPTNVLLSNYPDAYLHGSLVQLHTYTKNSKARIEANELYEPAVQRIVTDNNQRKYAGASLVVRAS